MASTPPPPAFVDERTPSLAGLALRIERLERFAARFAEVDVDGLRSALWGHRFTPGSWTALFDLLAKGREFAAFVQALDDRRAADPAWPTTVARPDPTPDPAPEDREKPFVVFRVEDPFEVIVDGKRYTLRLAHDLADVPQFDTLEVCFEGRAIGLVYPASGWTSVRTRTRLEDERDTPPDDPTRARVLRAVSKVLRFGYAYGADPARTPCPLCRRPRADRRCFNDRCPLDHPTFG